MAQEIPRSILAAMKNQIDASAIDLLDEEACLEAIFHASHAMAPGHRAEALEWGAAYLDLLRSRITAPHTAMPTRRKPCEALA